MAKKPALPIEVHDHFRKANVLHTYVQKDLGEATKHALETGQELMAAKAAIPHGRWENECDRLFDGSARTARFYMAFAKDMGALPKTASSAVLMLEGTLDGAAKAAKQAAKPPAPKPPPAPPPSGDPFEAPESPDTASGPEGAQESPKPPRGRRAKRGGSRQGNGKPVDRPSWFRQWEQGIGPLVRLVDTIAAGVGESRCKFQRSIQNHLKRATDDMVEWMKVTDEN